MAGRRAPPAAPVAADGRELRWARARPHLHVDGHSPLHRVPAHAKLVALVAFVLLVVVGAAAGLARPRRATSLLLVGRRRCRAPGCRRRYLLPRMAVEAAVRRCSPCCCRSSPRARRSRSWASRCQRDRARRGRGAAASRAPSASSPASRSPRPPSRATCWPACERLRVPELLVQIMGFMVRYVDVVGDEMRRMRVARESRGFTARYVRALADRWRARAGALFIRSYERGERVHLAMVAAATPADAGHRPPPRPRPSGRCACPAAAAVMTAWVRLDERPVARPPRLAFAYPDGHQALFGVDLHVHRGRAGRAARPERRRQDHAGAAPQRHPDRRAPARSRSRGLPVDQAEPRSRSAAGSASSSRTPTTSCSCRPCATTWPSGRPTSACAGAELERRVVEALDRVGMADFADRPPHHLSASASAGGSPSRPCWRCEPEILVLDEPSSNLDPASRRELADILRSLDVTVLMVTHDLPYALELCPRAVVLTAGPSSPTARPATCSATRRSWRATAWSCPWGSRSRSCPDLRLCALPPTPREQSSDQSLDAAPTGHHRDRIDSL